MTKTCSKCRTEQPTNQFYKKSSASDGLTSQCIDCHRVKRRETYLANKDEAKRRAKEWADQNRERKRANDRAYAAANRQAAHERYSTWYSENQDRVRDTNAAWRAEHPGHKTWTTNRERARKLGVAHYEEYSLEIGFAIEAIYNQPCVDCGTTDNIELDHVIPMAKGGTDLLENWASRCRSCNARKGDRVRF